jgi:hypothetical protein
MIKITTLLLIVLLSARFSLADYRIVWHTIDGGGGTSSGGAYQLTGTIGQPDAGYLAGGPYELLAGFWTGGPLCIVNLEDFAQFAFYWLENTCDPASNWCGGADLNASGAVDADDFAILYNAWLNVCPYAWPLK